MALPIEDYAIIGDSHTAALVGKDGSIDWLCLPRFDSASVFGALLGDPDHGRWLLAPDGEVVSTSRKYLDDTFVLLTRWQTPTGEVEVVDLMPYGGSLPDVIRRVRGVKGTVRMRSELRMRFDYASALPWVRQSPKHGGNALIAIAGPDALIVRGPELVARDHRHEAVFEVSEGEQVDSVITWFPSQRHVPDAVEVDKRIEDTLHWWRDWVGEFETPYRDHVRRSLLVLRALTHADTGGIVAAPTTSLPEQFGGPRNWDYRYVWIRDASLTLAALMLHGYGEEAQHWRRWLLRALAGDPSDIQIMYGLAGERRLQEYELDSLPGYQGASPVRIGNAASDQYQSDIFGELMVALRAARIIGVEEDEYSWPLQRALMGYLETVWDRPDNGIWEIRGPARPFTHSRVMVWAAFACAVEAVRVYGLDGPVERWEKLRDEIREEVLTRGYDPERNTFVQHYDTKEVDASLLLLGQIGFIAPDDPRMLGTVAAIEADLLRDGLVMRYRTESGVDGLPGDENPFLACSFWLVQQYAHSGRLEDARVLMDRLVGLSNDLGLLSEEYDVAGGRQAGNFPQAFSHLALVRAADAIATATGTRPAPQSGRLAPEA
ncbi:glucoamylase [Cnuibacter physcomitrellae]|uniref:Glucoamylase n=1 Tax=Cnuibacter physcomitrellae TaxID=1619308 RepID=A0A1X9LL27_9MICO|nr:glycoside hydrolase family 15 protein [Cnuibacter physcomitrellae]ARJ05883.1 glucoamylase [Cnuibacter physcomitrellae]GGI36708.1 glucoamylase [Cnuibacter physcomitrellae]